MKPASLILRTLLAWIALVAAQVVAGIVVPISVPVPSGAGTWMLFADFVTVAILVYLAVRTDLKGWRLGAALAAIPCAIVLANAIEGAVFLGHSGLPWTRIVAMTCLTYLLAAPAWVLLFGRHRTAGSPVHPFAEKTFSGKLGSSLLCDVSYLVLYYTAGMIIFPYVRDFYTTQTIPPFAEIVALQLLIRGPVFIAICLLLVRLLGLPRVSGAVTTALLFAILSGILPLLIPNPIFPDTVRWVHMAEVTCSHFVFAFLVAWLWTSPSIHAVAVPKAA